MEGPASIQHQPWWAKPPAHDAVPAPKPRAVAYYRHSAQDRQENSVAIQQEQVRQWAHENGIIIIREFADRGKSGLTAEGRDGFHEMMTHWVRARDDFQFVWCLDVSRWGRFQDIDLSATYSAECKRHGKQVVYTTLGKPKENDQLYQVHVHFERYRAAQYSKELSDKVHRGCIKIAQQGYWAGGKPPCGLQRLLLDESKRPLQVLAPGQRKSIQNQRVTLAPGAQHEIVIIRRIFDEFVNKRRAVVNIADGLNREGVSSPGKSLWDSSKVRRILSNELPAGAPASTPIAVLQKMKTATLSNQAQ
jgi:DNA invertase Pin-like site-specific DNA recombinase